MIASLLLIAALDAQLADCRAITEDAKRLACYDALAFPSAKPAASPEDAAFGASTVPKPPIESEPDRIEAHIVGKISGWRRNTQFTLDNGQVWKCVDDERNDDALDQPAVTIKRNWFGHYWMDVAGTGQSVQVIRIK